MLDGACEVETSEACASVVLADVAERLFKHVAVADLELHVERPAKGLSDFLVAPDRRLPSLKAHAAHNFVDATDDVLDDDRGLVRFQRLKQLGQSRHTLLF